MLHFSVDHCARHSNCAVTVDKILTWLHAILSFLAVASFTVMLNTCSCLQVGQQQSSFCGWRSSVKG